MERTARIHPPPLLRPDWIAAAPQRLIRSTCGGWLVGYDPLTFAGGCYSFDGQVWAVYGPIAFDAFLDTLRARRIELPDGMDLQLWIDQATPVAGRA